MAQEVQKLIPEAVSERNDGYLDLDTTPIGYAVINAIRELKAENDAQQRQIDGLKKRLEALKAERDGAAP